MRCKRLAIPYLIKSKHLPFKFHSAHYSVVNVTESMMDMDVHEEEWQGVEDLVTIELQYVS